MADEKKKLELKGVQTVEKKEGIFTRLVRAFLPDDVVDVKSYIVSDVLVPGVKDLASDIAHGVIDAALYGDTRGGYRRGRKKNNSGYIGYSSIFSSNVISLNDNSRKDDKDRTRHRTDRVQPIITQTRAQADEIISTLIEYIDQSPDGYVSIGDLYGALERDTDPNDFKWGWDSLGDAYVERIKEGYLVRLPKPKPIQ